MSDLLYEVKDKIATITLNRPDKLNAFTRDMIDAWAKALSAAQADDSVNVIVVTGSGRAFCSGGDVGRMREGEPTALDGKNSLWEGVHRGFHRGAGSAPARHRPARGAGRSVEGRHLRDGTPDRGRAADPDPHDQAARVSEPQAGSPDAPRS